MVTTAELLDKRAEQARSRPGIRVNARDIVACVHRGDELPHRLQACRTCSGGVKIKVFQCDVLQECTLTTALPGIACCNTLGVPCEHCDLRSALRYVMPETADCDNPEVVIDSQFHGYGDAMLFAWAVEGAKTQGRVFAHYARGAMADLVRCFNQPVVSSPTPDMYNVNNAYFKELRLHGRIDALANRCAEFDVPAVRPQPVEVPLVIQHWADGIASASPILMFPQATRTLRRWPMNYWLVLRDLLKANGVPSLVCCWGRECRAWQTYAPDVLVDLKWMHVIALMQRCRAVIGNNSGPVHVSGTLDIPTFVLSGLTTKESLEGIPSMHHVSVDSSECACVGCYYQQPPRTSLCDIECLALQTLTPSKVLLAMMEGLCQPQDG